MILSFNIQAQGIVFETGNWEAVLEKAAAQDKPIFVDAYTTWCGPCKWMAKNTFTDEKVGAFFTENYLAYKMDMEKGEGPAFAKKHQVNAYPTLLYFGADGRMMHKVVGGMDAVNFVSVSKDALDPSKQLTTLVEKYENGNRDKKFITNYLDAMSKSGSDISAVFKEYWASLRDVEKQSEPVLKLMTTASDYFSDIKGDYFSYFYANKRAYQDVAGEDMVQELLSYAYNRAVYKYVASADKKDQKEIKEALSVYYPEKKKELPKQLKYYQLQNETPPNAAKVKKARTVYFKVCTNPTELNSEAWKVYLSEDDSELIKEALEWIDRAISLQSSYFCLDTKAALLYKDKNYEAAKQAAIEALAAAKKEKQPKTGDTDKLLKEINRKLKQ
jgi:thiol-disulfide isomerase/thioredoxin